MRPTRLERATYGFEVRCSIQLSYRRIFRYAQNRLIYKHLRIKHKRKRVGDGVRTHDNQIHNLALYH